MRINPEFSVMRKLNKLIEKHQKQGSIPIDELKEITDDLEDFIKQEVGHSKLYILTASDYVDTGNSI